MRDQSGHHRRPSGRGLREVALMPMRARRAREEESNRIRLMLSTGLPMIPGNIRAKGIRTLAAWCLGRGYNHFRVVDASASWSCMAAFSRPTACLHPRTIGSLLLSRYNFILALVASYLSVMRMGTCSRCASSTHSCGMETGNVSVTSAIAGALIMTASATTRKRIATP